MSLPPSGSSESPAQPVSDDPGFDIHGERRIVTILFCDVTGSTAIAERLDPEEWAEIMNGAFRRLAAPVQRYEGTLVRLLGDAVLAFFGAPVAHEDDPERAVLAGLEMTETIRAYGDEVRRRYGVEFSVRIGINTGLVVVAAMGSELRTEYTAMGDAVNVAARMEQTAAPGTVQIAYDTYRLVAPVFEVQELGGIEVKGKSEPVRAYRVLRPKAQRDERRGLPGLRTPFVGREHELAELHHTIDLLYAGKGQIVAIMGEAGLGKSRLLLELREAVASKSAQNGAPAVTWLEGRSLSYETSTPYAPFADLLAQMVRLQEGSSAADAYTQLTGRLANLVSNDAGRVAPYIAALMGIASPAAVNGHLPAPGQMAAALANVRQLNPQQVRLGAFDAVYTLVAAQAKQRPTVLAFEDIHWIDPTSLDLLLHLLGLTRQTCLMVIALFRARPREPSWRFHEEASRNYSERYTSIVLGPLTDNSTRTLVDRLLDANELPDRVRQLILSKAEGNPFHVEEVIRSLLDAGWLARTGQGWRITHEVERIALPDTLAGVITARLDRLDEISRRVIQTAAVIGRDFAIEPLAEVSGIREGLEAALLDLQERDLIHVKRRQPQRVYMFKHVLTQETAYASLLLSRRRELHRRVAEVLERTDPENVNEIARHFLEARLPERALPYFIAAGDRAARTYAAQEAITHYSHGLEAAELGGLPAPLSLYRARGNAYEIVGEIEAARADFETALQLARTEQDRRSEWLALLDLGEMWAARDYAETGRYLHQAHDLARTLDDPAALAYTLNRLGNWRLNTGEAQAAQRNHEEALAILEQLGDRQGLAATHDLLGMAMLILSDSHAAAAHYNRAIAIFRELDDRQGLSSSLATYAVLNGFYMIADAVVPAPISLEESVAACEESLRIARAIDWRAGEAYTQLNLCWLLSTHGDLGQALRHGHAGLEVAQAIDHRQWITAAHFALGHAYTALLALAPARLHLERGLALAHTIQSQLWLLQTSGALASVFLWNQELDPTQAVLDAVLSADTPMISFGQRHCWGVRARLALEQKNPALALDIAERLYAGARNLTHPRDVPYLALIQGRALAALGRTAEAETALHAAEEGAASRGWRPLLWQVYVAQLRFYHSLGRQDEARHASARARAIIDAIAAAMPDDPLCVAFRVRAHALLPSD
jgi:class 3 adenylate cyclase/tetratricopeptide (TPR) repeat protein